MTTVDVYRWNGERAYHIFPATNSKPTTAMCGIEFPDTEESRTYWHHWLRQSGDMAAMQKWIVDSPLLNGHICEGCQRHA